MKMTTRQYRKYTISLLIMATLLGGCQQMSKQKDMYFPDHAKGLSERPCYQALNSTGRPFP